MRGGENARDGQFPYQVSFRRFGCHTCGGSILDETTILTAAHCISSIRNPNTMTLRVGNNKLSEQTEEYEISRITCHERYNPATLSNNICIVKLAEPINFHPGAVEAVKLRQTNIGNNESVTLSGWGTTEDSPVPNDLQFINFHTYNDIKMLGNNAALNSFNNEGKACDGDFGGPLVDGNMEQVGIVSWATGLCATGNPDVFTEVYSFLTWIGENRH